MPLNSKRKVNSKSLRASRGGFHVLPESAVRPPKETAGGTFAPKSGKIMFFICSFSGQNGAGAAPAGGSVASRSCAGDPAGRRGAPRGARQTACKPGSVPAGAGDGHSSGTPVAGRLARPTRTTARRPACRTGSGVSSLLGLAPGGVYRAAPVAGGAVRSYRTLSPLPAAVAGPAGGLLSVALSLGSPPPGVTRHRVSVEPGLSSPRRRGGCGAGRRPSGRLAP